MMCRYLSVQARRPTSCAAGWKEPEDRIATYAGSKAGWLAGCDILKIHVVVRRADPNT